MTSSSLSAQRTAKGRFGARALQVELVNDDGVTIVLDT
jgi:D-Tyr-tRNAtyr deacylase